MLQHGDTPEVDQLRAEGKLKGQHPTGIFEEGGQLYYIYPSIGKKVAEAGLPMVTFS